MILHHPNRSINHNNQPENSHLQGYKSTTTPKYTISDNLKPKSIACYATFLHEFVNKTIKWGSIDNIHLKKLNFGHGALDKSKKNDSPDNINIQHC